MERQIPIRFTPDGAVECDICPEPATQVSPETRSRELAFYCDLDAKRSVGFPERTRPLRRRRVTGLPGI